MRALTLYLRSYEHNLILKTKKTKTLGSIGLKLQYEVFYNVQKGLKLSFDPKCVILLT